MAVLQDDHSLVHLPGDGRLDGDLGEPSRVEGSAPLRTEQVAVMVARHEGDLGVQRERFERVEGDGVVLADRHAKTVERRRGARVVGHLQRLVEALEAARRRVGGGEIEDVAEQDQFAVVVPSDVAAHLREAESLRLVVKHPRERAVAEMQIAYRVEGHRARSLTPLIRRDGEISPPASALVRRREVALAQRRLRGRACRPRG